MAALDAELSPLSDLRAGAAYRRLVAGNLLRKFFLEVAGPRERGREPETARAAAAAEGTP